MNVTRIDYEITVKVVSVVASINELSHNEC